MLTHLASLKVNKSCTSLLNSRQTLRDLQANSIVVLDNRSYRVATHIPQRRAAVCTGLSQCFLISSSSTQTVNEAPAISSEVV
jgi:two-component SAPR family response regulator